MEKNQERPIRKAVVLLSGGLDSLLAARVILEQGIEVEGINFYTGFCVEGHTRTIRNQAGRKNQPARNNALWCAEQLGIRLHIIDIIEEYKSIVINPKYGYGANMNPCLDCKIFMLKKAHQWMLQHDFDFIVTGEVLGQRPMSQRRETLPLIQKRSGAGELLLRPLCARNLPSTIPEQQGWVDREQLYAFSGRGRKAQIELAARFGFEDYAQPAGGCCFLTDSSYSDKLKDLWQTRGDKQYEIDDIILLKVGRHLRPSSEFKLIIARDAGETSYLHGYRRKFVTFDMVSHSGPLTLFQGKKTIHNLQLAARIAARFGQGRKASQVKFKVQEDGNDSLLSVEPMAADDIQQSWYI